MAEKKITKNLVIPFIDVSKTANTDSWSPTWKRIDKSTIFDLAFNPQSTTEDYIAYEAPIEEISGYQPELPQEIALYRGNAVYDYVESLCFNLEVGDALRIPFLLLWPPEADGTIKAWRVKECRLLLSNYNSVDGKATFTLKIGGDIEKGTATVTEGVPVFVAKPAETAEA